MTFKLIATVTHKCMTQPIVHVFTYHGDTLSDILAQIDTIQFHLNNLERYRRTSFKDKMGAKHAWELEQLS